MNSQQVRRGGAAVGHLAELGPVEAGAVLFLRLWTDRTGVSQQKACGALSFLDEAQTQCAVGAFAEICELCTQHGRRPLMRHSLACECLGADESCFANFIGYAAAGQREDAFLLASNLVRPDMAGALVVLAEQFGLALKAMTRPALSFGGMSPCSATRH